MKNLRTLLLFLLALALLTGAASAQGGHIIYGPGFSFLVQDPPGFTGSSKDAQQVGLIHYFCQSGYGLSTTPALIYIRVFDSEGQSLEKNLQQDMDRFRTKHQTEFSDYTPPGLKYKSAAKKYLINGKTIDYVTFIEPYPGSPLYLAFVLSAPKEICDQSLADYQKILQSFHWIGNKVEIH